MKEFEGSPVLARAVARIMPANVEIEDAICELLLTKHGFVVLTQAWDDEAWEPAGYEKLYEISQRSLIAIEKYDDKEYDPNSGGSNNSAGVDPALKAASALGGGLLLLAAMKKGQRTSRSDILEVRYYNDSNKIEKIYFGDWGDGISGLIKKFNKNFGR